MNLLDGHDRSSDGSQPTDAMPGPAGLGLLSLVPAADRATVLAAARRVCTGAVHDGLTTGHDGLTTGSYDLGMVAITVAAMAPRMASDRLDLLFAYCRATIELDDRLDSQPFEQAQRTAESIVELIRSGVARANADPFEVTLQVILDRFRVQDRGAGVIDQLAAALADAVAAGMRQAHLSRLVASGTTAPPSATAYLEVAARDVNFRSVALALVLLCGERPSPTESAQLDRAISVACRAVRLANDHATAGKDRAERRLNIVGLRTDAGVPVTPDDVEYWVDQDVHAHSVLLAAVSHPGLATTTAALANSLRMAVGLYRLASRHQGGPSHGVRHQQGAARQ